METNNMELVKRWRMYGVTLDIFDPNDKVDGKWRLAYQLRVKGKVIFDGDDFYNSPMDPIDSLKTVESVLTFLTLKPGDTDPEYFDKYNETQYEFIDSFACESLRVWLVRKQFTKRRN